MGRAPTEGADQYRKGQQGIVQNGLEEAFSRGGKGVRYLFHF
jgi:hypothetical protein